MRSSVVSLALALTILSDVLAEPAQPNDAVEVATKKGARYLLSVHKPKPRYAGGSNGMGTACLAGLALLDCGIDEKNPSLQNIIRFVRENSQEQMNTYPIALAVMFLDRLGDPGDRPLIQFLAVRLMSGQGEGGWGYSCGLSLSAEDESQLRKVFVKETKLIRVPAPSFSAKGSKEDRPRDDVSESPLPVPQGTSSATPSLHPAVGKLLNRMDRVGMGGGDNSNTQFAALGLWCARKHGVPVERCMKALEKWFRDTQSSDGGWDYSGTQGASSPAMTCAGLIALAVTYGAGESSLRNKLDAPRPAPKKTDRVDPGADDAVKNGLKQLAAQMRDPNGAMDGGKNPTLSTEITSDLYFLWSLERVGVIYGLPTIGKIDWYAGGSEALIRAQTANGSWSGSYEPDVDTAFALLFLHRANVAKDLAAALDGKVKDPGIALLRSGGDLRNILGRTKSDSTKPIASVPNPKPMTADGDFETQVARLTEAVLNVSGEQRTEIIGTLRDSKGSIYTEALGRLVEKAPGDLRKEVREALARRFTRMTSATLLELLLDERREMRLAAATACGLKGDKQVVPDLIRALEDKDSQVAQAARASLHAISGKDFGPAPDADEAAKARSVVAWRNWWKLQP